MSLRRHSASHPLTAIAAACLCQTIAWGQSFQLVGLPPGQGGGSAWGVSGNGGVTAGSSGLFSSSGPGWVWTNAGGRQDLTGPGFSPNSSAFGISPDGNFVVGETGPSASNSITTAYRYNRATSTVELLGAQAGYTRSRATDTSEGGDVVVGYSHQGEFSFAAQAFRWTQAGGLQPLGFTRPGEHNHSEARAVSANGLTVVGDSGGFTGMDGFLWTPSTGMSILPALPGGESETRAYGLSSDASITVGMSGIRATRWANGSVLDLGLAPGYGRSAARAVSDDGAVIVGRIDNGPPASQAAAIWFPGTGWQPLEQYLFALGVTVPDNINLYEATGISRDGRTIVGYTGVTGRPDAVYEGFIVTIPAPATTALAVSFMLASSLRRRRGGVVQYP